MSSSWLRNYVLEGLGSEIRKVFTRDDDATSAETPDQARLVKILSRGQGGRPDIDRTRGNNGRNGHSCWRVSAGKNWWNTKDRGNSPNLAMHTNAWLLVSDGSHSTKVYLTIEALKEIFDFDNQNNNEDTLFGHGCCVLLKKYSFQSHSENENDSNDNPSMRYQHQNFTVQLKVSSLEPKPGFNHHHGTTRNHKSDMRDEAIIRPILEETEVLYGLRVLKKVSSINQNDTRACAINGASIARDWDISFGRLKNGRLSTLMTKDNEATVVVDRNGGFDKVLELAEEAASTNEAIREWEVAKKEYGITAPDGIENDSVSQTPHEENLSRMYIQNVLATSEEDESRSENGLTTQRKFDIDGGGNPRTGDDEDIVTETQPRVPFTTKTSAAPASVNRSINESTILSKTGETTRVGGQKKILRSKKLIDDDSNDNLSNSMLQTQPSNDEERTGGDETVQTATIMKRKKPEVNGFESGTLSNSTSHELIESRNRARKYKRRRRQQQLLEHQLQERPRNTGGIWESMKEQLFEPDRAVLYFVPSYEVPSSRDGSSKGEENIFSTPKDGFESATGNARKYGSASSVGTSLISSTPNPSSGAYFTKYGLARWLHQNTVDEEIT